MNDNQYHPVFRFLFLNPLFGILCLLVIITSGIMGYKTITKEAIPDVPIPQALVFTTWEGASPELVEREISKHIEQRIREIKTVKRVRSISLNSLSIISVEFKAGAPLEASIQKLHGSVNASYAQLPQKVKRPIVEAISVRDIPVSNYVLFGNDNDLALSNSAKRFKEEISQLSGVRKVSLYGHRDEAILIQLIQDKLDAHGVPSSAIAAYIESNNNDAAWGRLKEGNQYREMRMQGKFSTLEEIQNLPITQTANGNFHLSDFAQIKRGLYKKTTESLASIEGSNPEKSVMLAIYKNNGVDTLKLSKRIEEYIDQTINSPRWNSSLKMECLYNEADEINETLGTATKNAWQSMIAVFVILFFLLTWKEATIAAISIPIAYLASIATLWAIGYTFNAMVIIGLILATGLIVDDFILIMEGMHEGIFVKKIGFAKSAKLTISHYAGPSLSGSITTIMVFVPLMFLGGEDGAFIRIIPATAAICLCFSYLISLFIDVPLSQFLLKRTKTPKQGLSFIDRLTQRVEHFITQNLLKHILKSKKTIVIWVSSGVILFFLSIICSLSISSVLYPQEDTQTMGITLELDSGTPLEATKEIAQKISSILQEKEYLKNFTMILGEIDPISGSSIEDSLQETKASHLAGFSCLLKPLTERDDYSFNYANTLRKEIQSKVSSIPGARIYLELDDDNGPNVPKVELEIIGHDETQLRILAEETVGLLNGIEGVHSVKQTLGQRKENLVFTPKRDALKFYGVSQSELAAQMRLYTESDEYGKFLAKGDRDELPIHVGVHYPNASNTIDGPQTRSNLEAINIINGQGQPIPLKNLVSIKTEYTAPLIYRENGRRSVSVVAHSDDLDSGEIHDKLIPQLEKRSENWPAGYRYRIGGEEEAAELAYGKLKNAFFIAALIVYVILCLVFNNFVQPFIILSTATFALTGVFGGFFISGIPFSFNASVGIVSLVGIVVNDAIVMVDAINRNTKHATSLSIAAATGASSRIRPILSTTITTIAGLTPLALSDLGWAPLCLAIIFGLSFATIASIILIPSLYILVTPAKGNATAKPC